MAVAAASAQPDAPAGGIVRLVVTADWS